MQSRKFRYFLAVYDTRNLTEAARQVHVTQPALSRSLKALEQEMGVPLFRRRPHGIEPTRFADILARHARRMDMEYQHARAEIGMAMGGTEARIRIGAGPIWYSQILPEVLSRFARQRPQARFRVQSGVISTLVPQLVEGKIDLICSTLDFPMQSGLIREPVLEVEHLVVARRGHPVLAALAEGTSLSPAQIYEFPWAVMADDEVGTGRVLSYFAAHDLTPPRFPLETTSPTHMFEMLRLSDLLAQIPRQLLPSAMRHDLVQVPVEGHFWEARAGLCYRSTDSLSPTMRLLIEIIREVGGRTGTG